VWFSLNRDARRQEGLGSFRVNGNKEAFPQQGSSANRTMKSPWAAQIDLIRSNKELKLKD
jgi:hypothetical protein